MSKFTEPENDKYVEEFQDRFHLHLSLKQQERVALSVMSFYGPEDIASMFIESREYVQNVTDDVDALIQDLEERKTYA